MTSLKSYKSVGSPDKFFRRNQVSYTATQLGLRQKLFFENCTKLIYLTATHTLTGQYDLSMVDNFVVSSLLTETNAPTSTNVSLLLC